MPATQRDVRNRISAVKNIQKITGAMQLVAAARLRRAEQRIEALRPYASAIRRMTRQAAEAAGNVPNLPILDERENVSNVGLLLIAVIIFLPNGILGGCAHLLARWRRQA